MISADSTPEKEPVARCITPPIAHTPPSKGETRSWVLLVDKRYREGKLGDGKGSPNQTSHTRAATRIYRPSPLRVSTTGHIQPATRSPLAPTFSYGSAEASSSGVKIPTVDPSISMRTRRQQHQPIQARPLSPAPTKYEDFDPTPPILHHSRSKSRPDFSSQQETRSENVMENLKEQLRQSMRILKSRQAQTPTPQSEENEISLSNGIANLVPRGDQDGDFKTVRISLSDGGSREVRITKTGYKSIEKEQLSIAEKEGECVATEAKWDAQTEERDQLIEKSRNDYESVLERIEFLKLQVEKKMIDESVLADYEKDMVKRFLDGKKALEERADAEEKEIEHVKLERIKINSRKEKMREDIFGYLSPKDQEKLHKNLIVEIQSISGDSTRGRRSSI